jgi:hypothetical protein
MSTRGFSPGTAPASRRLASTSERTRAAYCEGVVCTDS